MNTNVIVAIITGITTILAPLLVKMIDRDRREEIDKELKILKQMNPESKIYESFNMQVEKSLFDFAKNDWLRSKYRNAYRGYIAFFLLLSGLYLLNSWSSSFGDSAWHIVFMAIQSILYFLILIIGGFTLSPLFLVLFYESKRMKLELELKIKEFHTNKLTKIANRRQVAIQDMERALQNLKRTCNMPESEEQEYAEIYNAALWWALKGKTREQVVEGLREVSTIYEVDTGKAVNDAFDYFNDWADKNEILKFIEIPRDSL